MPYWLLVSLCSVVAGLGGNILVLAAVLELSEPPAEQPKPPRGRLIPVTA